jgi:hypothetical protein
MTDVTVYDSNGQEAYRINISDTLLFMGDRVYKGEKCYYKGIGVPYNSHCIKQDIIDTSVYEIVNTNLPFYVGTEVRKNVFKGKTGIFQEQYQPHFSDFIGTCGANELSIIENSMFFEKSSIEVFDSIQHDSVNKQYYFKVNYRCDRIKYIYRPDSVKLVELIEYMLLNNWNFIWDKNSITDITHNGLVSDIADLFVSNSLQHKLGSVYSIIYSLANFNKRLYKNLISLYNLTHDTNHSYVHNAVKILEHYNINTSELYVSDKPSENYTHIVLNYLVNGKNCGDCCFIDLGNKIREQYIRSVEQSR